MAKGIEHTRELNFGGVICYKDLLETESGVLETCESTKINQGVLGKGEFMLDRKRGNKKMSMTTILENSQIFYESMQDS